MTESTTTPKPSRADKITEATAGILTIAAVPAAEYLAPGNAPELTARIVLAVVLAWGAVSVFVMRKRDDGGLDMAVIPGLMLVAYLLLVMIGEPAVGAVVVGFLMILHASGVDTKIVKTKSE